MAFKGLLVLALLFFSVSFFLPSSARDLKNVNKFQTNDQAIRFNKSNFSSFVTTISNTASAGWQTYLNSGEFHGGSAQISLWPISDVKPNSVSQYAIAVGNEQEAGLNVIMAGFHVNPSMYSNGDLRFFTYWNTIIGGKSIGCYNTDCPGFVVADQANLRPGQGMAPPLSTYDGDDQSIILSIKKDEETQDWSLYGTYRGQSMTLLGWWPKVLLTSLAESANIVQFGGFVSFDPNESTPPMGSGHFSVEGEKKAAYFKQITIFDITGNGYAPNTDGMAPYQDRRDCYSVSDLIDFDHSRQFYFGGPSGCKIN